MSEADNDGEQVKAGLVEIDRKAAHARHAISCLVLAMAILATVPTPFAQYRPGQPAVVEPERGLEAPPPADVAARFREHHGATQQLRAMLLWNREFSGKARSDVITRTRTQTSASSSGSNYSKDTAGGASASKLDESTGKSNSSVLREVDTLERDDPERASLSARNDAQLKRSFEARLRQGGLPIADYAMSVRMAAFEDTAMSTRQVETAALRSRARLLLQVLLVPDDRAPVGYGFDVTVREVATAQLVASFYTFAKPPVVAPRANYQAGEHGFELRRAASPAPTLEGVGATLADEVMEKLMEAYPGATTQPDPRAGKGAANRK